MTENISEKLDLILSALENGTELTIIEPAGSVLVGLVATIGTALFTIVVSYLAYLWQRNISGYQIKKRVCNEIYEVIRHLSTNRAILKEARAKKYDDILAYFHFEKMKISDKSLFFDDEVIKHYPLKWDTDFRQIALFLRNNNIELDYIIDYLKNENVDKDRYNQLVDYYLLKLEMVVLNLHGKICEVLGGKCEKCIVLKKCNERKKIIEATNKDNVKGDEKGVVADMDLVMDENGLCRRDNKANKYVMKDTTYKYIFHQSKK
jgi:hypothetical protein